MFPAFGTAFNPNLKSGELVSMGLDITSAQYLKIQQEFQELMQPDREENYQDADGWQ